MGTFADLSEQQQEKKLFAVGIGAGGGGAASVSAASSGSSFMAASSSKSNNNNSSCSTTQFLLDSSQHNQAPQLQGHQQQFLPQEHHQNLHHQHLQHNNINQISFGMMQPNSSSSSVLPSNFICKDPGAYDLGELDQALFLYLDGQDPAGIQEQRQNSGMRPPTLNIFPSQPMHVDPSSSSAKASTGLVANSPSSTSGSKRSSEPSMDLSNNPRTDVASAPDQPAKAVKHEGNRKGPTNSSITSEQEGPKTPDPKTLRRLAQNREAARKSRLRKKAYVQQLENSRIKLTKLEQELQRARAQGYVFTGSTLLGGDQNLPNSIGNTNTDAAMFDMEYARWLDEHHRILAELQNALQNHVPENELRLYVDSCLAHFDDLMSLKGMIAKADVFHLISGMWKTPAERCFMWMGGFRPSELIKIIMNQIDPLPEQQLLGICGLQQSTQEAEEALSQGLEALNQSLSDTVSSDAMSGITYMSQMAIAMNKLSTLEGFVRQGDNLRHQTIHRLRQILTTRQAARCFLAMAEYNHRLRSLSTLWLNRPRQEYST